MENAPDFARRMLLAVRLYRVYASGCLPLRAAWDRRWRPPVRVSATPAPVIACILKRTPGR